MFEYRVPNHSCRSPARPGTWLTLKRLSDNWLSGARHCGRMAPTFAVLSIAAMLGMDAPVTAAQPTMAQESENVGRKSVTARTASTASKSDGKSDNKSVPRDSREVSAETNETRSAESVIQFAREHHPELADLLLQLQSAKSLEFGRAVRQLSAEMTRLERSQERSPQRFDADLQSWKLESQTRLLLARWAMSRDPVLEQQIRDLLRQRREIRITQLSQEKQRLQERMETVIGQIDSARQQLDEQVDEEWQRLSRRAGSVQNPTTGRQTGQRPSADNSTSAGKEKAPGKTKLK